MTRSMTTLKGSGDRRAGSDGTRRARGNDASTRSSIAAGERISSALRFAGAGDPRAMRTQSFVPPRSISPASRPRLADPYACQVGVRGSGERCVRYTVELLNHHTMGATHARRSRVKPRRR